MNTEKTSRLALVLWIFFCIFILRVTGQLLVVQDFQGFLPPMEEWQSGILPYPLLLISQIAIIIFYGKICIDFTRNRGYFVIPNKRLGKFFFIFGGIYFVSMILRYIIYMTIRPEARWLSGTIPIFTHCVLAAFLIFVGIFHSKNSVKY